MFHLRSRAGTAAHRLAEEGKIYSRDAHVFCFRCFCVFSVDAAFRTAVRLRVASVTLQHVKANKLNERRLKCLIYFIHAVQSLVVVVGGGVATVGNNTIPVKPYHFSISYSNIPGNARCSRSQ